MFLKVNEGILTFGIRVFNSVGFLCMFRCFLYG